jgi:ABC-2 type transport system permease protein
MMRTRQSGDDPHSATSPMMRTLRIIGSLCLRTWQKTARRPTTLAFSFVQPVMWILFFGFLFQRYDIGTGEGARYLDFLVAGVCAMTVLFGASQSGIGLLRDLQTGFLGRMLRSTADPLAVVSGKLLADVLRLMAQAFVIAILGILIGAKLTASASAIIMTAIALCLFAITFCSVSCFVALKTGAHESMATFVHLVNMPLLFTSSALVPTRQMPDWLATLSRFNPLTAAVDVTRNALLFDQYRSAWHNLILLGGLATVSLFLVASAVRRIHPET